MKFAINEEPLISIIMPAYNCEKYIQEAINSVLAQTFQFWELIVIDDASKDETQKIVAEIAKRDPRILFHMNKENLGVSFTRNKGIAIARGQWIAFLDSDDMWETSKLEKQLLLSKQTGAEFLYTGSSFINEKGDFYQGIFEVPATVTYKKLRLHNVISCSSVLIKKRYFDSVKMENDDMHEDYAVWLRVLKNRVIAHGVREPLLIYRISHNSKSGNKIKSIKMTYKVFRFIGVNPIGSVYFMCRHLMGSIKKYRTIKIGS